MNPTGSDKLKEGLGQVVDTSRQTVADATQMAKLRLADAKEKLEYMRNQLAERYHSVEDANYEYVVRHPGCSLTAVALVGAAIGYLLANGRSHH